MLPPHQPQVLTPPLVPSQLSFHLTVPLAASVSSMLARTVLPRRQPTNGRQTLLLLLTSVTPPAIWRGAPSCLRTAST